jgi:hypothetical protein
MRKRNPGPSRTTEGKPTSAIRASPLLLTSKPEPPPDPAPGAGSSSWARSRASFLRENIVSTAESLDAEEVHNQPTL